MDYVNILWISYFAINIYAILFNIFKRKRKRNFLIIVAIQLILIFALRDHSVGVDILRYERTFNRIENGSFTEALSVRDNYENIGYFIFNFIISKMGMSFQGFLGIVGIICVIPMIYSIYKYSEFPCLSILIYMGIEIYSFQFSGIKQAIAMSIVLLAFLYIEKNDRKKFYILLALAILFHPTSIIALPMYWILKTTNIRRMITLLMSAMVIIYIFRNQIGEMLMLVYDSEYIGRYESSGTIGSMSILLILLLLLCFCFAQKEIFCQDKMISQYFRILLIATMLQFLSSYAYAFTRINYYYLQFLPIISSKIIALPMENKKNGRYMLIVSFLLWCVFFCLSTFMYKNTIIEGTNTFNYKFFF